MGIPFSRCLENGGCDEVIFAVNAAQPRPSPTPSPTPEVSDVTITPDITLPPISTGELPVGEIFDLTTGTKDIDCDGKPNAEDNCPFAFNPHQVDSNRNRIGDICEGKNEGKHDSRCDSDKDGVLDQADNCILICNPDQKDKNKNGHGDLCDASLLKTWDRLRPCKSVSHSALRFLTLTMTPARKKVLPLEPVLFKFGLANSSGRPQLLRGDISLWTIKLSIRKPSGKVVVPSQLTSLSGPPSWSQQHEKPIEAGGNRSWNETLEFNLSEYFGEVGEYGLKATYDNGRSTLSTEWVALIVVKPEGEDLAAYERLKTLSGRFDGVFTLGTVKNRLAFAREFPNSRYADYSLYSAALDLSDENIEWAKQLLSEVATKPDFVFAHDAKMKLNELSHKKEK